MIADYFNIALTSIRHRKLRAWLTIIGIVIGVAAIIALISLTLGLQASIEEQFKAFGSDKILISAQGFQGPGSLSQGLTDKDVDTIKKVPNIDKVTSGITRTGEVNFKDETKFLLVYGIPSEDAVDFYQDTNPLESGRYLNKNELSSVLIGYKLAKDVFDSDIRIKNKITINNKEFRVAGIFKEVGNQQDDNIIVIPLESFREIFDTGRNIDFITAKVKSGSNIELTQERIEKSLEKTRDDKNFQVLTPKQILDQINQILGILQFVLVGIAAISLIVGAVGITNSMYTSILERTKEIGIMKAIGAKNSDILSLFLIESGLVGLVGGFFGVILGTLLSYGISKYATQAGFRLIFSINLGLLAFGLFFAFIIGIISGVFPARQASKLKPVDALRYE